MAYKVDSDLKAKLRRAANNECRSSGRVLTEKRSQSEAVILCLLQVKRGEADLVALQRRSHEDHRPHRGHHIVRRDVFLPEIGENDGGGMKKTENRGKERWGLGLFVKTLKIIIKSGCLQSSLNYMITLKTFLI